MANGNCGICRNLHLTRNDFRGRPTLQGFLSIRFRDTLDDPSVQISEASLDFETKSKLRQELPCFIFTIDDLEHQHRASVFCLPEAPQADMNLLPTNGRLTIESEHFVFTPQFN